MKTKKQTGKKVLSVFLAVLMIMTAWVFVPGEHQLEAEAGAPNSYDVSIGVTFSNQVQEPNSKVSLMVYHAGNTSGQEFDVTSQVKNKGSATVTVTVSGFPTQVSARVYGKGDLFGEKDVIEGRWEKTWINGVLVSDEGANFKKGGVGNAGWGDWKDFKQSSRPTTWLNPYVSAVVSNPTAQTLSVPATGSVSNTFTATYKDQYGVTIAGSGATGKLDSTISGVELTMNGNSATVKATIEAIDSFIAAGKYNTSTGKATSTLTITNNGVEASCTVTFQAPSYTVTWKNWNNTTLETDYTQYYGKTPSYGDSTLPTRATDGSNVYTFSHWSPTPGPIKADTTYTAQFTETPHTWPAEPKEENRVNATCSSEGSRDLVKYCTVCGYELERVTQTLNKQPHTFTAEVVHDDYLISAATCNKKAKYAKSCVDCGERSELETSQYTFEYGDFDSTKHIIEPVAEVPAAC
ncbi:MAG: hypothetical protein IJ962_06975, partial [Clostridia bacterium]|nr:hypothetical protein [Clostridia bacterium]MBR2417254.1 hypothetical protein [Clostridia bacterium]